MEVHYATWAAFHTINSTTISTSTALVLGCKPLLICTKARMQESSKPTREKADMYVRAALPGRPALQHGKGTDVSCSSIAVATVQQWNGLVRDQEK